MAGTWFFKHDDVPEEANCEFCNKMTVLPWILSNGTRSYCSEKCFQEDQKYLKQEDKKCILIKKSEYGKAR